MTFLVNRGYQNLKTDSFILFKTYETVTTVTTITIYDFLTLDTTQVSIDRFHKDICQNYRDKRLARPTKYLRWYIRYGPKGLIQFTKPYISAVTVNNSGLNHVNGNLTHTTTESDWTDRVMKINHGQTFFLCVKYGRWVHAMRSLLQNTRLFIYISLLRAASHAPAQRHWMLLKAAGDKCNKQ